jgi:hypothetical protein
MDVKYPALRLTARTGQERFVCGGQPVNGMTLQAFWCWGVSNVVDNIVRGLLAEYIVASALELTGDVRGPWEAHDLTTRDGLKIEVKCSAYLQSWGHHKLSSIQFGIRPTRYWNHETNEFATVAQRQADLYVFCLLKHQEKPTLNPLDLDQWEFYVVPRTVLDQHCGPQKSITLKRLLKLGIEPVGYPALRVRLEAAGSATRRPVDR